MRLDLSDLYWLTDEQMARLEPYFPKSHGKPRVHDRRVLSGFIFVNWNGLRWRYAPKPYGPHKPLYNRWKRRGGKSVFLRMIEGPAAPQSSERKTVMTDATYLKAHHTASSLPAQRMARPFGKRFDVPSSLRKRIRPFDTRSLAKMDIRASWSS